MMTYSDHLIIIIHRQKMYNFQSHLQCVNCETQMSNVKLDLSVKSRFLMTFNQFLKLPVALSNYKHRLRVRYCIKYRKGWYYVEINKHDFWIQRCIHLYLVSSTKLRYLGTTFPLLLPLGWLGYNFLKT